LRSINVVGGNAAAREADQAMAHAQSVSVVLDLACVLFTASLAALALVLLRRAVNAEASRADELDAFTARVAHDLRGPLSAPLMALQWLAAHGATDARQVDVVERGIRSLKRVNSLIHDLLAFARAGASLEPGACTSLPEAVSGALSDSEGEAVAADVRIDVAKIPGRSVCCAPGVLSSILENLVRNAVKHMPAGRQPRVVCIRAEDRDESVRVEVADTGSGIPAELQKDIFEPYVRATSGTPGLGLGLATVRRLVQAHGGRVGVRSEVGQGSTFWFELPARAP
jgi:signal transduction histidine kinase